MRELDTQLAARFVCTKCRAAGGSVKRIAATGTGLSRLLDVQHNQFVAVTCTNCGYTELYSPQVLGEKDDLGTALDILFGH